MTLGIIPAAGAGSRIQPLAFSKELLPVGARLGQPRPQPRAVSEYIVERMKLGGAAAICFVISPRKTDVLQYYRGGGENLRFLYAVQDEPRGLCDAIFQALPLVRRDQQVLVGLPDTVWFPADGLCALPSDRLAFLLFPVSDPSLFDAVVTDEMGNVEEIAVKSPHARSSWIWGAFSMPGRIFIELHDLWRAREREDEFVGTLVNAYLRQGGKAVAVRAGESYMDVGTLEGYREAVRVLGGVTAAE